MSKRLPSKTREHLAKARESCLAGVAAYNNPTTQFRTGSYIVLVIIAWTSLFHAIAYRNGNKPWRVRTGTGRGTRYERVGDDYKHWDLNECMRDYFGSRDNPVRANLRFLIELRDRIEHRDMPDLDHEVFGECQAALLNFEDRLVEEFGERFALAVGLAPSLQFSRSTPEGQQKALARLKRTSSDSVVEFVRQFRAGLAPEIVSDQRFAFKVFMVPQLANHRTKDTLAVEWVPFDPEDPQAMAEYDEGVVLLKQKHVEVRNPGALLPRAVTRRVAECIPCVFNINHHTGCWKHFEVRPPSGVTDPAACDTDHCQWDGTFKQYVYTDAWVDKLCDELRDAERFGVVTGIRARPKPDEAAA